MRKFFRISSKFILAAALLSACGSEDKREPKEPKPYPEEPTENPVVIPGRPEEPKIEPDEESCVGPGKSYRVRTIQYPKGSAYRPDSDCDAPIVVGNNGTGAFPAYYVQESRALAAAGFMVIWPTNTNTGNGRTCLEAFDWGFRQPNVYQEKYGITGHSQGGSATLTCGYKMQGRYRDKKASLLPVQAAVGMGDPQVAARIRNLRAPSLFFSGTRDTVVRDDWVRRGYAAYGGPKGWIAGVGSTHFDQGRWIKELAPIWFKSSLFQDPEGRSAMDALENNPKWRWMDAQF